MNFKQLNIEENIIRALDKLGYTSMMPVQEEVIPNLLNKRDVLVKSKTGSGKTAAYAIPLLQTITWEENKPQALILVPTRELALQVKDECNSIGVYKRMKTYAVFGKQPMKNQIQDLKQKTHMVVGTPGRVLDHLERGTLDISKVEYIVLDEADEMLNMGFIDSVENILSHLPENVVMCMFSATLPDTMRELSNQYLHDPVYVEMQQGHDVQNQIEHYAYIMKEHEKMDFLWKFLLVEKPSSAIIFCKTQEHVNDVCDMLYEHEVSVDKLHGGMLQQDRIENINDFKAGKLRFLVATDVAARGIDIEAISHVINYDFPLEQESYVHRIGRTARKDAIGKAISFISQYDGERVAQTEAFIQQSIEKRDKQAIDEAIITDKMLKDLQKKADVKLAKDVEIKKEIMKLYINGGKKKKLRAGDFVGAICEIKGITAEDIGIIQIQDQVSYIQILNGKGKQVLKELRKKTIKGKKLRIDIAN